MTEGNAFRLLVLTDTHASSSDNPKHPKRRCALGRELLRRAVEDAKRRGGFDAVALLGDLTDDHDPAAVGPALAGLAEELRAAAPDAPVLVVPGNHDDDARNVLAAFSARAGVHEPRSTGGAACRFVVFADPYTEADVCTRREEDRRLLLDEARRGGPPIVVLQHNPMNPVIDDAYPYMLTNREQVMRDYSAAGVVLCLCGHYHRGQESSVVDGVRYCTVPALCESSFRYAVATVSGGEATVEVRSLVLPRDPRLRDCHAHTQFAYCGRGLSAEAVIQRAREFGLAGVCLVEHAPQLYCSAEDFWAARHIRQPELWRRAERSRMPAFRAAMEPLRSEFVRVGLEVEVDAGNRVTLRDEDRDWPDLLVGAVHWLPEDHEEMDDARLAEAFLGANRVLLDGGIDVLAHPWRFFRRAGRAVPKHLYGELADMLARAGAAAEVNFHTNQPDPAFFAGCARRGVRIALGSDAHELYEVGAFGPHLDLLSQAGSPALFAP